MSDTVHVTSLNSNWRFRLIDEAPDYPQPQLQRLSWMPASVPGHVHLDLVRHGVMADPFQRLHEFGSRWVDESRWSYETEFTWKPRADTPRRVLRFNGLDTVCRVTLNDHEIGRSNNMFVPLEIDVTDQLAAGLNRLRIDFDSAVRVGVERRRQYFADEGLDWKVGMFDERAFVRKAQYMSGWDWGPRLVSCGIWASVELLAFRGRIKHVSFLQERLPSGRFRVWAESEVEGEGELELEVAGRSGKEFELEPDLWWPANEGPQHLISARARLSSGHEVRKSIGLRTIRLLRERDELGRSFEFEVNGRRIWCRGANWIPDDSFVSRIDADALKRRLATYPGLGFNMLRVWGGGFYESEAFYDACDQAGLLVWQDFPYACSYYPDSDEYRGQSKVEAEANVLRLRDRASLALFCGNNENDTMWHSKWGGEENSPSRYYGDKIYAETLPEVVERLSPAIPYIRSSPTAVTHEEGSGDIGRWGDSHYWDVWHGRGDWKYYEDSQTRFSSEYGFASSCSLAAWSLALLSEDWAPHSAAVRWHDKTGKGHDVFHGYVELHYPKSETLEDWAYYSQLNQRDALRHGVEHYRRSEYCRGSLIWQINDCWPVQSWAMEDYRRLLKPAGHEMARVYAHTMVSIHKTANGIEIWLVNDGPAERAAKVVVELFNTETGAQVHSAATAEQISAGERRKVLDVDVGSYDPKRTAVRAFVEGEPGSETWALLCEPKELVVGKPELSYRISGDALEVQVDGFVHDLVVWDAGDPEAVLDPRSGRAGWSARSAANGSLVYTLARKSGLLMARSLAGDHVLRGE